MLLQQYQRKTCGIPALTLTNVKKIGWLNRSEEKESGKTTHHCHNNNNNAIYIAQIRAQQQMGCRMISVQTERLSA